jgi:uncharacterized membrane protein
MGTILVMIALLVVPYAVLTALDRKGRVRTTPERRGVIGLALLFFFTASGHFVQTDVMADMLPSAIPRRTEIIYATGVLELVLAFALLVRSTSRLAACAIIVTLTRRKVFF